MYIDNNNSLNKVQIEVAEKMFLYGMEMEEDTSYLKIFPMNGNSIILHGEDEAKFFISLIMDHYQNV